MLRAATEFPHPGSQAFLADSAEPARILRHNPDQTTFVSLLPTRDNPLAGKLASGNRTVSTADLCATIDEAQGLAPRNQLVAKPVLRRQRKVRTKDRVVR